MSLRTAAGARLGIAAALAALAAGCASLPPHEGRVESFAIAPSSSTALGAAAAQLQAQHPGLSGIHPLPLSTDAFAARVLLAAAAERSIDAQYYIWHADQTGLLLFEAMAKAGRRGARVRILLDDVGSGGIDEAIAALGAVPNVEVRLYNPFANRGARFVDYLTDFGRMNRRMHNKVLVADNAAAIVGGRNVGNEYFGAGTEVPFKDLDVLAVGPAVLEASAEFDLYWNSASAYPAARLVKTHASDALARLEARFIETRADPSSRAYVDAVRDTPLVRELLQRRVPFEWTEARLLSDDPRKTLGDTAGGDVLLLEKILAGADRPHASLDIISPYFVPGERGASALENLARNGVRVRVLTNSYGATDVSLVHSGYAKRRCRLARAGVRLYELKASGHSEGSAKDSHGSGSSAARLHAKTYAADGRRIFVGSFNFDPRSALLNTEMGLLIRSETLAGRLAKAFDDVVPAIAYEVRPRERNSCVEWIERQDGREVRHEAEPQTGWARRAWLEVLMAMPLDWLL